MSAILGTGLAWFCVWLFAQAALHKLFSHQYYRGLMVRYVGDIGSGVAVWLIAALETFIVLMLILPQWRVAGLAAAAVMLVFYAALMITQLVRGEAGMQCGCAGPASSLEISWALVVRNGVCAGLAILAMSSGSALPDGLLGVCLSGFVALFTVLVYLSSEQNISNAQQWTTREV